MVTIRHIFKTLAFAAFVVTAAPAFALVEAHVDRNPVAVDQSFTLSLQSSNDGEPDLKPLQQDFEILGQGKSSSFQIVNGNTSRKVSWQIMLMPKRAGQFQIPALTVKGESSAPIAITITAAGANTVAPNGSDADSGKNSGNASQRLGNLFVDVSAEPHSAYVQQQVMLTVRLYRAVNLGNGNSLSEPKFPNGEAAVEKLGDDREYQTTRNGQNYVVVERRYALYPQKSGSLAIDPIQFDGNVIDDNGGGGIFSFDPFGARGSHVRVRSEPVTIQVKPSPPQFSGKQWLPASKLTLTESWSQDPPVFAVGEPVTRTLTITAQGANVSQLPALDADTLAGFKLYPDQPVLKSQPGGNGAIAVREQKIAMIPTTPGELELPAIDIKWWNTTTDREEVAHLPARRISVLPGTNAAQPPMTTPSAASPQVMPGSGPAPVSETHAGATAGWWPWLALFLGLGWLATVLAWWRTRSRQPHTIAMTDSDVNIRTIEGKLQKHCAENDGRKATTQLLEWAKLHWPIDPPTSLTAMARLCDPVLAEALKALDRSLYANTPQAWDGKEFWKLFVAHKPRKTTIGDDGDNGLQPLYRTTSRK